MKIADSHAHIFPEKIAEKASHAIGEFYDKESNHLATLNTLIRQEAEAGISEFVISSSATVASQVGHINDFIARCVREYPHLIGMGALFPTMDGWEEELERMIASGIRGVKIHPDFQKIPIDEPKAIPMYKAIAKAGLPVLFHTGDYRYDYSAPERLENLIRQVPDLVAIAAHFGGWQSWDRSYAHVLPENVFYDTSSSLMYISKEQAMAFLDKMGPHRFLFGTDFPMWTPKEELTRFLELELDETAREQILYGNFKRLFPDP